MLRYAPIDDPNTRDALAAVAVSSAAMAQVTVSGNVDARYESSKTATTAAAKGFLISDAQLHFTAAEDLGGGLKATARFTIDGATSDGATTTALSTSAQTGSINRDGVFVSLAGGFGTVTFSSLDSSDYLGNDLVVDQLTGSASGVYNGGVQDRITYTSPTFSGVRFQATMQDGDVGTRTTHDNKSNLFEIYYADGPISADVGMITTDKATNADSHGGSRFRVGYNFGVASVSYGQINAKDAAGVKDEATQISVSVPMGALSLSYAYATINDGSAATKRDGTALAATYALSKRTSLTAQQVNYENATITNAKRTRVTLSHAF
jgi:predicted porin